MDSVQHCAYNQSRGCILSLEVEAGDFSFASLEEWMPKLTPGSGAGLWLVPFKGIPSVGVHVPLDLIYLDEDSRVVDLVETFPTFLVSASSPSAASVLALPAHSISASQTQMGDELMLCSAEEMAWLIERFKAEKGVEGAVANAVESTVALKVPAGDEPAARPGVVLPQAEVASTKERAEASETVEKAAPEPPKKKIRQTRSWLERWLFPNASDQDKRTGARELAPSLIAHFWTGGAPQEHGVRDISATGLYVVTTERWYPGTQVRITLTKTDSADQSAPRSITVQATAIRWGNDGVGLEFVLQHPRNLRRGQRLPFDGADSKQLDEFLKRLRGGDR